MLKCAQCDKTFEKPDTFRKHNYRNHNNRSPAVIFNCYHCRYSTKYKFNLDKHVRKHFRAPKQKVGYIQLNVCRLCNTFECADRDSMIHHYQNAHDIQITERKLCFTSDDEFLAWKCDVESEECCRFVTSGGARKRLNISVKYLRCFRDGHYTPMGTGKRKLKVKGSCKIGSVCPSSMKVSKNTSTGAIIVTYIARHIGHDSDPSQMNINKEQKDNIAIRPSTEVPNVSILDSFCDSIFESQVTSIQMTTPEPSPNNRQNSEGELLVAEDNTENNFEASVMNELPAENQAVCDVETQFEVAKRALIIEMTALIMSTTNMAQLEVIKKTCSPLPHEIRALEAEIILTTEPLLENMHPYDKITSQAPLYDTARDKITLTGNKICNPTETEQDKFAENFLLPDYSIRDLLDVNKENG